MKPSFGAIRAVAAAASQRLFDRSHTLLFVSLASAALGIFSPAADVAQADENGISFWIPGFFGSLAATPQQPGWSLATINYFTDVSASGNVAVAREIGIGQFNPAINGSINANVHANVDLQMFIPTYVFATPFLGGQASASLIGIYGANNTSLNATFTGTIGPIPFTKTISLEQTTWGSAISSHNLR